ncbi:MAG: argininosuccinate lyase [Desulfobacterales bacterium]|jgi:argininosuccinate lyase|nr:argininosuccinate lyase [Desulfobacterales bacterium]
MADKLWDGRFSSGTAEVVERFTASIDVDRRLYRYDIEGSIAHSRMLAKTGILAAAEAEAIVAGLEQVRAEIESGGFVFDPRLEDIHMHIESRLTEIVGPAARKVHTGRSRNDQVALDLRLYLRDALEQTRLRLIALERVLIALARAHIDVILPGYTHLQRAQPVLLAHHFMAYVEMFARDRERFADCRRRTEVMPLGSAALAGTTFPIDRAYAAGLLGFPEVSANSLDAVSDRDFVIEFLAAAGLCMMHLSRLSEELVLWSSAEFGFIELPDSFATGSSIMPQKKNPDVAELVRGKTGRVYGHLMGQLTLMKGLPLSYNRDLQEDKAALFDAVDTLCACLEVTAHMLPGIEVRRERMAAAAEQGYLNATDLADYLVRQGLAFREAHHVVGRAVREALAAGRELHELALAELQAHSPLIGADVFDHLRTREVVDRRSCPGGTGRSAVLAAIAAAEQRLA